MLKERADVIALCIDRLGFRKGARLAEFITAWEVVVRKQDGPVGIEDFAQHWHESPRTAYRRLALFREAFPQLGTEGTPNDLLAPLLAAIEEGTSDASALRLAYAI